MHSATRTELTTLRPVRTIARMGPPSFRRLALAALLLTLSASASQAQRPVCAPVAPGEPVITVCRSFSLYPVVRFLSDFTVDHLFKPAPPPFARSLVDAARLISSKEIADHERVEKLLAELSPILFTRLDRTTGSVVADWKASARELITTLDAADEKPSLAVRLPELVRGGYWRGPDVLQIAFWEGNSIAVEVATGGTTFGGDVECLSLSPDTLLLRFRSAASPPLSIQLRECLP